MLKEMLTRKKPEMNRKIEINPYVTDAGIHRSDNKGVLETILAVIPFRKKKEEVRTNPFLTPKPVGENDVEPVTIAVESKPIRRNFLWYIPAAIAEQIEWIRSKTSEGKRAISKRNEDKARYEHFLSLIEKKD